MSISRNMAWSLTYCGVMRVYSLTAVQGNLEAQMYTAPVTDSSARLQVSSVEVLSPGSLFGTIRNSANGRV